MTKPQRRFKTHSTPGTALSLRADHPAVLESRTLFPSTVVDPRTSPRLLINGINSRKIGSHVSKGEWSGFPIFTLTLEERATCPKTCHLWRECYGNAMHFARRHRHGQDLENRLMAELAEKQRKHPAGFIVRLHVLGDFYSLNYVNLWWSALLLFPALRVFGYTAHSPHNPIGKQLEQITFDHWDRFAIRFSGRTIKPQAAVTVFRRPDENPPNAIICPVQLDKSDCCGTCALCWSPAAKDKAIVFIAHGKKNKLEKRIFETPLTGASSPANLLT